MIEIITGDLLEAKEKYIAHQTNCISTGGAAGIARIIFDKWPYADCYIGRKETSTPSTPGTIDIRGNGIEQRRIINVHAQYYPGKCRFPLSSLDGLVAREKYFYKGLLQIAKIDDLESIAFPWRIGCGLGGGDWEHYIGKLTLFSNYLETKGVKVVIYRRVGDE